MSRERVIRHGYSPKNWPWNLKNREWAWVTLFLEDRVYTCFFFLWPNGPRWAWISPMLFSKRPFGLLSIQEKKTFVGNPNKNIILPKYELFWMFEMGASSATLFSYNDSPSLNTLVKPSSSHPFYLVSHPKKEYKAPNILWKLKFPAVLTLHVNHNNWASCPMIAHKIKWYKLVFLQKPRIPPSCPALPENPPTKETTHGSGKQHHSPIKPRFRFLKSTPQSAPRIEKPYARRNAGSPL